MRERCRREGRRDPEERTAPIGVEAAGTQMLPAASDPSPGGYRRGSEPGGYVPRRARPTLLTATPLTATRARAMGCRQLPLVNLARLMPAAIPRDSANCAARAR